MKKLSVIVPIIVFSLAAATVLFQLKTKQELPTIHGMVLPQPHAINPFSLQSTESHAFTDQSLKGKWSLLFFGYTHCPDICPTILTTMNQVWQKITLPKNTAPLQFIFVSIDPARDSITYLKEYVTYFNKAFIGATGSDNEIKQLTAQLGVPYFVDNQNGDENYLVDHGSMIILINPNGAYQAIFTAPHTANNLLADIPAVIKYY